MKVAVQMDPVHRISVATDSTVCLIEESLKRGFDTWYYTPSDLYLENGLLCAKINNVEMKGNELRFDEVQHDCSLKEFDVILVRQDPPVNMLYLTTTYLLENLPEKTLIVNNPRGIRDMPEKLFALSNFSEFMPPTIVTENLEIAEKFLSEHDEIVLKPLYGHGGNDIFKLTKHDFSDFRTIFKQLITKHVAPLMLQKFLPAIRYGDKRVILVDGELAGVVNRIPQEGSIKANMVRGGKPERTTVTDKEKEICMNVGRELKKRGIIFAGLDIIGEYLTEINVTSPTGIRVINALYGLSGSETVESKIWEAILRRIEKFNTGVYK